MLNTWINTSKYYLINIFPNSKWSMRNLAKSETNIITKNHAVALCEKCPYSEFFWSAFSRIRTEIISPNPGKRGPEKLGIRTLFKQRCSHHSHLLKTDKHTNRKKSQKYTNANKSATKTK